MAKLIKTANGYEIDYGTMQFSLHLENGRLKSYGGGSSSISIDDRDWDDYAAQAEQEANDLFRNGEIADDSNFFKNELLDELYVNTTESEIIAPAVVDINDEMKRYFAKHPEKLYNLSPRQFEKLIADILSDLGFEVKLTQATRDGGKDIYAYIKNQICGFLMYVECKSYTPPNRVGLDIVQRLYGVQQINKANKSMIVTTSYFTLPAVNEAKKFDSLMSLKNYDDLKEWLQRYK